MDTPHSRSTEPKMALKGTVFIMFFILSPIVADLGGELQKEIDRIKLVINKQVLKALDDLSTKAGKCTGTRIVVITSYKTKINKKKLLNDPLFISPA